MENDIVEAIETAISTNNEGKEEDSIPVELVDKEKRFQNGYRDREPVTIRFQYISIPVQQQQQQKPKRVFILSKKKNWLT